LSVAVLVRHLLYPVRHRLALSRSEQSLADRDPYLGERGHLPRLGIRERLDDVPAVNRLHRLRDLTRLEREGDVVELGHVSAPSRGVLATERLRARVLGVL